MTYSLGWCPLCKKLHPMEDTTKVNPCENNIGKTEEEEAMTPSERSKKIAGLLHEAQNLIVQAREKFTKAEKEFHRDMAVVGSLIRQATDLQKGYYE